MTDRAAAARHARALLDVTTRESDPDRVGAELEWFAALLRNGGDAARLLMHPAVPAPNRAAALKELSARAGLSPLFTKLLVVFAEHGRLGLLPQLADAYRGRLLERKNIMPAEITTAVPLPADRLEAVRRSLSEVSAKQVLVSTRTDPGIIGGVIARVGSIVYDGSVASQLARMRQKLVENA